MSLPKPRGAKDVERLEVGEWVRNNRYFKRTGQSIVFESHKVGKDGRTAPCGRPLNLDLMDWTVGGTLTRCSYCKRGEDYSAPPEYWSCCGSQASGFPMHAEGRKAAIQFEAKVQLVKRLLGATEVT